MSWPTFGHDLNRRNVSKFMQDQQGIMKDINELIRARISKLIKLTGLN